jgi:hypothetical protein
MINDPLPKSQGPSLCVPALTTSIDFIINKLLVVISLEKEQLLAHTWLLAWRLGLHQYKNLIALLGRAGVQYQESELVVVLYSAW